MTQGDIDMRRSELVAVLGIVVFATLFGAIACGGTEAEDGDGNGNGAGGTGAGGSGAGGTGSGGTGSGGTGTGDPTCADGCDKTRECFGAGNVDPACEADCEAALAGADRAIQQSCINCVDARSCASIENGDCAGACSDPNACDPMDPNSCDGETVCIDAACEAAFGRFYTILIDSVIMNETDDAGDAWDFPGGLPDPKVEISVNGTIVATTSWVNDTLNAAINESVDVELVGGSSIELTVYDDDNAVSDWVLTCSFDPVTAMDLRYGDLSCVGPTGNQLNAYIYVR